MPTAVRLRSTSAYTVTGAGPPVLLLPGWRVPSSGWGALVPRLAGRHTVIAVDNRAAPVGRRARPGSGIAAMADDAVAVLDAAGVSGAHVVGNSLGGLVAQALARRYPERVLSLVLLSTSPGTPSAPPSPFLLIDGLRAVARRIAGRGGALPPRPRWDHRPHIAQLLAPLGWCGVRELPQVHARTLVIHGSRDRVVPLINARLMANLVPSAQLIAVEGAGHLILTDAPEQVEDAIAEFLAGPEVLLEGALGILDLPRAS